MPYLDAPPQNRLRRYFRWLLAPAFFLLCSSGCFPLSEAPDPELVCVVPSGLEEAGRMSFFLNLKDPDSPRLRLEISRIEVSRAGVWLPVDLGSKVIDTEKIGGGQIFLGQSAFTPATYDKLRLSFSPEAVIGPGDREARLLLAQPTAEIAFAEPHDLSGDSSDSLFLTWDVAASLNGNLLQKMAVVLEAARPSPVTANHIYAASPDLNTIYAVRTDKRWVDRSYHVSGRPTYIAIDDVRQKLFILCRDEAVIKVIDLVTNHLADVISLPSTFKPNYMEVSDDLSHAFVADEFGNLSKLDLRTGNLLATARIGRQPNYIEYIAETRTVAVSSARDNRIYLVDEDSFTVKDQITVSGNPAGLLKKGDFLYITENRSNTLTIYDINLRRKLKSLFVGYAPRRIIDLGNNIYVANSASGSLSLLRTQNQRVTREIHLGNEVYEMAASEKDQLVYIGKSVKEDCGGSISVLDVVTDKIIDEIEIGSKTMGMVIGR